MSQATPASAATAHAGSRLPSPRPSPDLVTLLRAIDPQRIQATIQTLAGFGTRHTLSSQTDPNRGIGAATN